jgi:ABC-2 type transport system permease protein
VTNVFSHELARRRKPLLIWSTGMVLFMVLCMFKFETLAADAAAMRGIMDQFPQTIQAVFGMSGLDITTLGGYFGVCFLYIALLLTVQAGLLGVSILAEEEQDKTTEFLYVKPIGRAKVITQKLAAGLIDVMALWLVTVVSAWACIAIFATMEGFETTFWLFMGAALLLQIVFFFLGSLCAGLVQNSRSPGRIIATVVFASYVLYVFSKLSDTFEWLRFASVFRYFDAADIIKDQSLNTTYVLIWAGIAVCAAIGTYIFYSRRDLEI